MRRRRRSDNRWRREHQSIIRQQLGDSDRNPLQHGKRRAWQAGAGGIVGQRGVAGGRRGGGDVIAQRGQRGRTALDHIGKVEHIAAGRIETGELLGALIGRNSIHLHGLVARSCESESIKMWSRHNRNRGYINGFVCLFICFVAVIF